MNSTITRKILINITDAYFLTNVRIAIVGKFCSTVKPVMHPFPTVVAVVFVVLVVVGEYVPRTRHGTCAHVCMSRLSRASGRHAPLIISLITGTSPRRGPANVSANDSVQAVQSARGCPSIKLHCEVLGNLIMAITIRPFEFTALHRLTLNCVQ